MRAVAVILGLALIAIAIAYWMVPAGSLPGWFPGFEAGMTRVHVKHGAAAAIGGFVLLGLGWWVGRSHA
jgi:hypothetical protein